MEPFLEPWLVSFSITWSSDHGTGGVSSSGKFYPPPNTEKFTENRKLQNEAARAALTPEQLEELNGNAPYHYPTGPYNTVKESILKSEG